MAFSKTPTVQTEQTKLIRLMEEFETRSPDGLKDVTNQNVIWDQIQDEGGSYFEAMKRDGCRLWATIPSNPKGMYFRSDGQGIILATSTNVYFYGNDGTLLNTPIPVNFAIGVTPVVRFTEFLYDNGTVDYIATNGDNCYVINSTTNTATNITDPDFPTDHLAYPVFLDGYLFIATANGNIYNSDLNNPLSWSASNLITAESYADGLLAIARHGQYIAAFGRSSIQFFYDAANPTGTPLATQTTVPKIGFIGGLASAEDTLYFIGQAGNSKEAVYYLKSLTPVEIQSFPVSRRLHADGPPLSFDGTMGNIIIFNGHALYTWCKDENGTTDTSPTYALDLQTKQWCSLSFQNGTNFRVHVSIFVLDGTAANGRQAGSIFSFRNSPNVYQVQQNLYQDAGVNFTVQFTTKNKDFDTRRRKFGSRMLINCDQTPTSSTMQVTWSVDDYQTYVPTRSVDASLTYPALHALGAFRKVAFKVTYADNFPMRWRNLELDYSQGDR